MQLDKKSNNLSQQTYPFGRFGAQAIPEIEIWNGDANTIWKNVIFVKVAGKIFWISSQSLWATGSHIRIQLCNNQTLVLGERKEKNYKG